MSNLDREAVSKFQNEPWPWEKGVEVQASTGGLPPLYVEGFSPSIDEGRLTVGAGEASVDGARVSRDETLITEDMYVVNRLGSFSYYLYLTRAGDFVVDIQAPKVDESTRALSHPQLDHRYVLYFELNSDKEVSIAHKALPSELSSGDLANATARDQIALQLGYTDYASMITEVSSSGTIITSGGFLRADLIEAESIIASKIAADAITTSKIAADAITSEKMNAENFFFTKAVGSESQETPASGDVRAYLGKDPEGQQESTDPVEMAIKEYNGENWETRLKGGMRSGGNVADLFVSGFFQAGESVLSSPGLIWKEDPNVTFTYYDPYAIGCGANGTTIVNADLGTQLRRSTDGGKTWSSIISVPKNATGFASNGGSIWVGSVGGTFMMRSTNDGVSWSDVSSFPSAVQMWDVAYGNGVFVTVGNDGIFRSTDDGASWTREKTTGQLRAVYYGDGVWIAVGASGLIERSVDDGDNWSTLTALTSSTLYDCDYGDGVWVLFGGNPSYKILRSDDAGATFSVITDHPSGTLLYTGVHYRNVWIAGGTNGVIRSTDGGVTWGYRNYSGTDTSAPFGAGGDFLKLAANDVYDRIFVTTFSDILGYSDWLEAGSGIVEQGENSNGSYIVFSSGLQVCWRSLTLDADDNRDSSYGSYGWSFAITHTSDRLRSLPRPFASSAYACSAGGVNPINRAQAWSASSVSIYSIGTSPTTGLEFYYIAIGEAG